jgi:hypothetical protein
VLAAGLASLLFVACGDAPSDTPPSSLPRPDGGPGSEASAALAMPPDGQIRLRIAGDRITLHASAAPRLGLLESLARELDFALVTHELGNDPVSIRVDGLPLSELLSELLPGRSFRVDHGVDLARGGHRVVRVEVWGPDGEPPPTADDDDAAEGLASEPTGAGADTPDAPDTAEQPAPEDPERVDWKELLVRLDDADAEERLEALGEIDPDGEGLTLVMDRLARDPDPRVRAAAAEKLEFADTLAAVDALVLALNDPETSVVLAAIDALEFSEDPTVVADLALLLDHPDPEVREAAQDAIEFISDEDDEP